MLGATLGGGLVLAKNEDKCLGLLGFLPFLFVDSRGRDPFSSALRSLGGLTPRGKCV